MKVRIIFLTILMSFFIGIFNAYSFCVYNATYTTQIRAVETSGGSLFNSFAVTLIPRTGKCCSWRNNDCNVKGKKDSLVEFTIYKYKGADSPDKIRAKFICKIKIKAESSVVVKEGAYDYICESK